MKKSIRAFPRLFLTMATAFILLGTWSSLSRATDIQSITTDKGITAWLVEDDTLPLIAMQFAFIGGANQDLEGKRGTANLVSGMLDEGAGPYDSAAFQEKRVDLAARMSFSAGLDNFSGNFQTLSKNAEESFELLRFALNEPRFEDEPLQRVRSQIESQLRGSAKNPNYLVGRAWFKLAYKDHPYALPATGSAESIANLSSQDLKDYAQRVFARDNLRIAVVGDISPEELKVMLDSVFGELPEKSSLRDVPAIEPYAGPSTQLIEMDIPQTVIRFGHRGIEREDDDFIAAFIVNHILGGGGFSSRLYKEVREKRGLAYSVYSYLQPLDYSALFLGGVATQNARAGESLDTIIAELTRLAEEGPSEIELTETKSFLKGSYALRFDTSSKIARQLLSIQIAELGIDYINDRNGLIEAVTIEDVKRVAKRLLSPNNLLITLAGKPEGVEAEKLSLDGEY